MPVRKLEPIIKALPPADEYLQQIDMDRVADAIYGGPDDLKIPEYDIADAKAMIWTTAEKFLPRDLYDLDIDGIEEPYESTLGDDPQVFRGVKDLTGRLRGRLNVTKKFEGKKVVIDWKTTHNTLTTEWDERLLDSWQWRKYLLFGEADVMLYRGIARPDKDGVVKTRELLIERPANLREDVEVQLKGVALERQALIDAGLVVYPRRMPGACGSFGRECPFWTDCRDFTMPRAALLPGRSFSYSSMDKFMLCPERYRRGVIAEEAENTEESTFGQAIHRGMAELYTQIKAKFQQ